MAKLSSNGEVASPPSTYKGAQATRRDNLRLILRTQFDNNQSRLADAYGAPRSFINRLLNEGPNCKSIGENLARALEAIAEKPRYWLDHDHSHNHDAEQATEQPHNLLTATSDTFPRLLSWSALKGLRAMKNNPRDIASAGTPLPPMTSAGPHSFIMPIADASMEPEFSVPEHILVDTDVRPQSGDFVVAFAGEDQATMLRKYIVNTNGDRLLEALKSDWPERILRLKSDDWVVGKVVFKYKGYPSRPIP